MFHRRHTLFVPLVAAVALATPSLAFAGPLVADAPDCDAQTATQVFSAWADPAYYVPAPGGTAETAAGWSTSDTAKIVAGNEPWQVHDADDGAALRLPPGASATTGTMCIGIENPDLRFFVKGVGGSVAVDTLVETASGDVVSVPAGVASSGAWSLTTVMPIAAALLPLLPGNHTPVRFRFTSTGQNTVTIDDVYVDPFGRY